MHDESTAPPLPQLTPKAKLSKEDSNRLKVEVFALVLFVGILAGVAGIIIFGTF